MRGFTEFTESPSGAGEADGRSSFWEMSKADRDAAIRAYWQSDLTAPQVAAKTGLSTDAVQHRFIRLGRRSWIAGSNPGRRDLTPDEIQQIRDLRTQRQSMEQVATALKTSESGLRDAMKRAGVSFDMPDGTSGANGAYTPERIAVLAHHWPAGTPRSQVCEMLNALPGPPISFKGLGQAALVRGIARGKSLPGKEHLISWSEARVAVLTEGWPAGRNRTDLCAALNALPGKPITFSAIEKRAAAAQLKRPRVARTPSAPRPRVAKPVVAKLPKSWVRDTTIPAPRVEIEGPKVASGTVRSQDQPSGRMGGYRYDKPVDSVQPRHQPPTEPIVLPPPAADGRIEMQLLPLMWWCKQNDIHGFDGAQVAQLNVLMDKRKRPHFVVVG